MPKKEAEHATKKYASNVTTDHEVIRQWAEDRGGKPACVKGTAEQGDIGMIRLDFPGYSGEEPLEPISWDDWFEKFEESNLAFVYQDEARGQKSNFNKVISRESEKASQPKTQTTGKATPSARSKGASHGASHPKTRGAGRS